MVRETIENSILMTLDEVEQTLRILKERLPGDSETARGPKNQPDPFRACISCMLSAQSLDRNTAAATRALFELAKTPEEVLALSDESLIAAIRPAGLYNRKAKNIRRFCQQLIEEKDGVVPDTRDGLLSMYGIGRKCADLVAHFVYGAPHIAVDTHIRRVCQRTGLAVGKSEAQIAASLDERAPHWAKPEAHFWLLQFGKQICQSRTPLCENCPIAALCRFPEKTIAL